MSASKRRLAGALCALWRGRRIGIRLSINITSDSEALCALWRGRRIGIRLSIKMTLDSEALCAL